MYAENYTETMAKEFTKRFHKELDEYNRFSCKPYKVEVSTGWRIEVPKAGISIFTMAAEADKVMYEIKKKRKESKYLRKIK